MSGVPDFQRLEERLRAISAPLSGLSVVVLREGMSAYEGCFGRRYIDPERPELDLPVVSGTKFRVASISKTVAAIGAMTLVDRGLLDLDADLSPYLGFELRNPLWPDKPISAAMLLSHTSSIRDASGYSLPLPRRIGEFFLSGSEAYEAGAHFSAVAPGGYYSYSNLNYGVLATAMERISGERFDLYMRRAVLEPLALDASYNVLQLTDEGFGLLAPLYRRGRDEGAWEPEGPWKAQVDDYRGFRPGTPCALAEGLGPEALDAYELGSNGTLFSPQGGLRISAVDLARIAGLLMNFGASRGARLISEEAARRMMSVAWRYDSASPNGDLGGGSTRATGLGLVRTTGSLDARGGDRLLPSGGPLVWGHHADAYGLLGGLLFAPETGFGLVYLIGGTPSDPARYRGSRYSRSGWEEAIIEAIAEACAPLGSRRAGAPRPPSR